MAFEGHITVDGISLEEWKVLCSKHNIQPIEIALSQGEHSLQRMCVKKLSDIAGEAVAELSVLKHNLESDGVHIVRMKFEVDDYAQRPIPTSHVFYYECHIQWQSPEIVMLELENQLRAQGVDVAISENILRATPLLKTYYATARTSCYDFPNTVHRHQIFSELNAKVMSALQIPTTVKTEAVIFDTNKKLDKGWINMDL